MRRQNVWTLALQSAGSSNILPRKWKWSCSSTKWPEISQLACATLQLQKNLVVWNASCVKICVLYFQSVSGWNKPTCLDHQISSHAEFNSPGIPAYCHTARQDNFTKSCLTRSLPEERGWDCHRWPLFHIGCLPTITAIQIAAHSPSSLLPDYQLERQFDWREY